MTKDNKIVVAALYKFVEILDVEMLRDQLKSLTDEHDIYGTLLLAKEGINGTVCGTRHAIDILKNFLLDDARFLGTEYKESFCDAPPFHRMKVKIKEEIVTFGEPSAQPHKVLGTYVNPKQWDELIEDPEVTVLDVRNDYEVMIGTFKNAIDPKTKTFREFVGFVKNNLDKNVNKKIAMSCTGGIRCEKASSYMKSIGFEEVYHLQGGVLKYLEETPKEKSNWVGECFVFDQRVTVDHDLQKGSYEMCFGCRLPIKEEDKNSRDFQKGVCCPKCVHTRSEKQIHSARSRQEQIKLAQARGEKHIGRRVCS